MTIMLNGEAFALDGESSTVRAVLRARGWSFPLIAVSVNGDPVPRSAWDDAPVRDGDAVEALHLMSGG